jgi:hypothetical protein
MRSKALVQRTLLKTCRTVLASQYAGFVQATDAKLAPLNRERRRRRAK